MSVYVDKLFCMESSVRTAWLVGSRCGHRWCHMFADTEEELLGFADRLGLKRKWVRGGRLRHFDLVPSKRRVAVDLGAVEVDLRQYLKERYAKCIDTTK